jgi:hypothetical protein
MSHAITCHMPSPFISETQMARGTGQKVVLANSAFAGTGPYLFGEPCWTCYGSCCQYTGEFAKFGGIGSTNSLKTSVIVPGGGKYALAHELFNGGLQPNSWQSVIGWVNASFGPIVLESFTDAPAFNFTYRELPFSVPEGTTAITVNLEGRQVSALDHVVSVLDLPRPGFDVLSCSEMTI